MNLGNLMETMKDEVSIAMHEADKFSAGNKAAGRRARKAIGEVKKLITEYKRASVAHDKS